MELLDIPNNLSNKSKVAIVCVGYNRIKSMCRLLDSLLHAKYPSSDIPLVISVDCSGDTQLYDYVENFEWPYGDKYVNIQKERLGLKKHIFQCGDLTELFQAIILLEDDIFVSPYFYDYALQTIEKYGADDRIGQISLYRNETNGFIGLPFTNISTGSDVFLIQSVTSWGECWTNAMWKNFKRWMKDHGEDTIKNAEIPEAIKTWTNAWSKYYHTYLVDTNRYVVYPSVSLTTNFSDAGVHGGDNHTIVQSHLQQGKFVYRLYDFKFLEKYDSFYNNIALYDWLEIPKEQLCLDIYGINMNIKEKKYILTTKQLPFKLIKKFGIKLRPIELNVKYKIAGEGISLYEISPNTQINGNEPFNKNVLPYYLGGLPLRWIFKYTLVYFVKRVLYKIGLLK